jgi:hypothetical protein
MGWQLATGEPGPSSATKWSAPNSANDGPVRISINGRNFVTTTRLAGIFLRHAQQVVDDGDAQLVPLLHRDGIELLLLAANIPFSVHDASQQPPDYET